MRNELVFKVLLPTVKLINMKTPLEIIIGIEEQLKIVDDSLNKIQVLKLTRYMAHQMRDVIPMYTGNLNPKWKLYDEAIELAESRLNGG